MKTLRYIVCIAGLLMANAGYTAIVSPIQADYGNVFSTLTKEIVIDSAFRSFKLHISPFYPERSCERAQD